jgi:hypothetical protein
MFEELLQGWGKAFGEFGLLMEYRKKAVMVKYASENYFELEDYTPEGFLPRQELLDQVPEEIVVSYIEYGLTADGLPCFYQTVNADGSIHWAAFYRYSSEAVEFVEYNLAKEVPRLFQRMVFERGRKVAFLRSVANGGGAWFFRMTGEEAVEMARKDESSIFLYEQCYEYEGDHIVRDRSDNRASGIGFYHSTGLYSYDASGKLIEIKDVFGGGQEELRYVAWDASEGLNGLSDRLAREMAESIVNALLEEKVETPVAMLDLFYHYADVYMPMLSPLSVERLREMTEKEGDEEPVEERWQDIFLGNDGLYNFRLKGFERTFAQFMNQVDKPGGDDWARQTLRKMAALLTRSKLLGRIPVSEEFFAYAMDGTLEGFESHDFKEILLECGMSEELYEKWCERGWMK